MSNYVPADATVISSLPYAITQAGIEASPTGSVAATCFATPYHPTWWRYTTGPNEIILALAAVREVGHHSLPTLALYTGTPGSLTQYQLTGSAFCGSSVVGGDESHYFKIPVAPNTTYYIQVIDANNTGSAASVTLTLLNSPQLFSLRNAVLCATNGPTESQVFNAALQSLGVTEFSPAHVVAIVSNQPNSQAGSFYVVTSDHKVTQIGATNITGQTWTLPAFTAAHGLCCAVNREGTILYYLEKTSNAGGAIKRYDLVGNAPMSDLVAGFGSESVVTHGYVDADGRILFPYRSADNLTSRVRRFNVAGIVTDTYTGVSDFLNRIHWADDDPGTFWAWGYDIGVTSPATFKRIRLSDGVVLTTLAVPTNVTSEIGVANNTTFGVNYAGWMLKANEGLLISDNSDGFPTAVVNPATGDRSGFFALSPLSTTDIYSVIEAAIMAPVRAPIPVIPPSTRQWKLHRIDAKQRTEETA